MDSNTKIENVVPAKTDAIKDSGRVHIGGGAIHFTDVTPREATKDAGRVTIGGGAICF